MAQIVSHIMVLDSLNNGTIRVLQTNLNMRLVIVSAGASGRPPRQQGWQGA